MPVNEEHVAEINDKKRYNPSILELKPNVHLSSSGYSHHGSPQHSSHSSGHHHQAYQPLKFRPTVEIKDFKPSYQTNHEQHSDIIVGSTKKPPQLSYKPGTVLKVKPVVKKIKLVTPGLKHYATQKFVSRNDYQNYFRSRRQDELRHASNRMVQNMYQRSSRALLAPQYAPGALNYDNS